MNVGKKYGNLFVDVDHVGVNLLIDFDIRMKYEYHLESREK